MGCGCRNKGNNSNVGNDRYLYYTPRQLRNRQDNTPQAQPEPPVEPPVAPEGDGSEG